MNLGAIVADTKEKQKTFTKEDYQELSQKAFKRYFERMKGSPLAGYVGFNLLEDVKIIRGNKIFTIPKGCYFQNLKELINSLKFKQSTKDAEILFNDKRNLAKLYRLRAPIAEIEAALNDENAVEIAEGVSVVTSNFEMNFKVEPVELLEGDYLTFDELLLWCILKTYKGKSKWHDIFNFAYNLQSNSPVEQNSEIIETPVTQAHIIENQFAYIEIKNIFKGFDNLEDIEKGETTLATKDGFNLLLTFSPKNCIEFHSYETSNQYYLRKLRTVVCQLLRDPQTEQAVDENNVAWIPSNKILQELTRRQKGVNTRITDNQNERNKLHSALKLLQTSTLEIKDPENKPVFNNVIFQIVGYRKLIKDKQGNEIKDAWGFVYGSQNFYFHQQLYQGTRHRELNAGKPAKGNEIWISEYLEADILPIIYNQLYPKRGKPKRSYTVPRYWSKLYNLAVKAAEPTDKVKRRVRKQFEDYLNSVYKSYATDEKQIYIKAVTENDKLLITGYKKPYGSPIIEL